MKNLTIIFTTLIFASCAQNKIPKLELSEPVNNGFKYLENLQFSDKDLVITVYSDGSFFPQTNIVHTIFRNGNVEQIKVVKMMHKEDSTEIIELTEARKTDYLNKLNSQKFQDFIKTTPQDFDAKIDYKECNFAISDASTEGIIITQNGKQNHYKKYAPYTYLRKCDLKNKQLLQNFYDLIQDFKTDEAEVYD